MQPRTLELSGDGSRLVAAYPASLHVVDRASRQELRACARPALGAFAIVGDALWSVTRTADGQLLDVEGCAEQIALTSAAGRFVRNGAHLAWVSGGFGVQLAVTATGSIDATPIEGVDFMLPLSATRWIVARQGAVQLRDTTTTRWTATPIVDGCVSEGAVVFDGRAVALFIAQRADRAAIVVLGLRDGGVQHRIALHGATLVRFAPRRGVAFVVLARRRLVMIDLRFGRIVADHTMERDIAELATDDAGQVLALRQDDAYGEILELDTDELLRAPRGSSPELAVEAVEPEAAVVTAAAPVEPVVETAPAIALQGCPALPLRRTADAPSPDELRALLRAQRQVVVAQVSHALARAWDEGRASPDRVAPARTIIDSLAGLIGGLAADDVLVTAGRVDAAHAAYGQLVSEIAPRVPPLVQLADALGLDALAQQIILVVAAPALWGELANLYGLLCNDPARPLCDELLVTHVLATHAFPDEIAAALDADAPLVRHGIIHVGGGLQRPFLPLGVDPIVLRMLRGLSPLPVLGAEIVAPVRFEDLHVAPAVKQRIVDDLARTTTGPLRVVVRGRSGSGRHTVLATIAAASGYQVATLDASSLDDLSAALQRMHLAGVIPCIDNLERSTLQEPQVRDRIRDVIAAHPGPVFVRLPPEALPPVEPGYVAIDLPAQSVGERAATWEHTLARAGLGVPDSAELAARFAVGPATITRVVERIAREPGGVVGAKIDRALRQHLDGELGKIAKRVERLATWSQVVLPPDIQDSVTELIGRIRHRRTVFDRWGFDRVMSTSRGTTALFQGGPGTGKTLVAGAIANELGLDLYRVDVSRIMSKWVGETEQNLAKLFDAAEDGNAIILFDEADSLFAKRTEVKSSNDRFANLEVNYLLQRLDSFEGIAIMTTNFGTSIDSAFKRRLSFRLTFPFPDEEQRERLWRAHLPPQLPVRGALDLTTVAQKYRLSGGYIRNCALRAAFLAAEQGGVMTADHLERAIKAEFREIGKLADTGVLE